MCRNRCGDTKENWAEWVSEDGSLYSDVPSVSAIYDGEAWIEQMKRVRLCISNYDDAEIARSIVPHELSELKKVFKLLDNGLGVQLFFEPGEIDRYFRDALITLVEDTAYAKVLYEECDPYEGGSYEGLFEYDRATGQVKYEEHVDSLEQDDFDDTEFDSES